MLSLVYKDFLLQRNSKSIIYMLVMPIISTFAIASDALYVILPYIAGSYLYIVYANALDDKFNSEKIYISMPIKRFSIIAAKYIGVFIYMLVYFLIISIVSFISSTFIPDLADSPGFSWTLIVQFVIVASIYFSIIFPIYFKLGYHKSKWVNYIAMIVSAGSYALLTKGLSQITGKSISSLQAALEYLTGIQPLMWNIMLPLFSIAFIAISISLSVNFFSRREF